jgi:hypothetical protein
MWEILEGSGGALAWGSLQVLLLSGKSLRRKRSVGARDQLS